MSGNHWVRLLCCLALVTVLSACDSGTEDEQTTAGYGTADAALLVLPESKAPEGMTFNAELSGPQTVYQFAGTEELVTRLDEVGSSSGYANLFSVFPPEDGEPVPRGPLEAVSLSSRSLVFAGESEAREALDVLWTQERAGEEVVRRVEGFGDGAFFRRTTGDEGQEATLSWRSLNAVVELSALSSSKPKETALLQIARRVAQRVEAAQPSREDAQLPIALDETGAEVFSDDFDKERGWLIEGPPPLSRYVDGGLQVGIDGPGGRWHETNELGQRSPEPVEDMVVQVEAERAQGGSARWGVMCRVVEGAGTGFYVFVVGTDGYVGIYSAPEPSEPLDLIAELPRSSIASGAVRAGQHRLRADCTGDETARLTFRINDQIVLDAFDHEPLGPGGAGLWIESRDSPASVLFDDLVVSAPTSD